MCIHACGCESTRAFCWQYTSCVAHGVVRTQARGYTRTAFVDTGVGCECTSQFAYTHFYLFTHKNGMFLMQLSSLCTGAQHTSTETTTHTNTNAQTRAQARALFKSACISLIHTVAFTGDDMNFARERAYVHAHKDHKHANTRTRKRKPSIYATHSKRNGQHFLFPHT